MNKSVETLTSLVEDLLPFIDEMMSTISLLEGANRHYYDILLDRLCEINEKYTG